MSRNAREFFDRNGAHLKCVDDDTPTDGRARAAGSHPRPAILSLRPDTISR